MESVTFNEIISSITQLNKEKKDLYKENIVEICRRNYNADPVKVTLDLQKCIGMNFLKIVKNQFGKESYRIIKDIEVNHVEDTISFTDSMYEEMKYKNIIQDIMNLI